MENKGSLRTSQTEIKNIKDFLKRYFVAGLLILLPLWLTVIVFTIVFNWTSSVSMSYTLPILKYFIHDKAWVYLAAKILSFFLTIIIICFVGFFATNIAGRKILKFFEEILVKIPVAGGLYIAFKKFISFFSSNGMNKDFKRVVFIPYPNKDSYSVAFATGEKVINNIKYITAFMPTTPNPTTGFLILVKEEDVIESDFTVEDSVAYIMSGGIISPKDKNCLTNLENKNGSL